MISSFCQGIIYRFMNPMWMCLCMETSPALGDYATRIQLSDMQATGFSRMGAGHLKIRQGITAPPGRQQGGLRANIWLVPDAAEMVFQPLSAPSIVPDQWASV
jgi:hypothetical protein